MSAAQYREFDGMRTLGGTAGQRIARPRIHGPLADGLFDSESTDEDPELQAGGLEVASQQLSYDSIAQRDKATPEETREVTHTIPRTRNVMGATVYYTRHARTRRWYTRDLKRHGRAWGGISNS